MLKKSTEQTSAKINSIIGSDMTVEGNIRAKETVRVEGSVTGNVETDADWDGLHKGMKSVTISTEDVFDNASFYCEVTI